MKSLTEELRRLKRIKLSQSSLMSKLSKMKRITRSKSYNSSLKYSILRKTSFLNNQQWALRTHWAPQKVIIIQIKTVCPLARWQRQLPALRINKLKNHKPQVEVQGFIEIANQMNTTMFKRLRIRILWKNLKISCTQWIIEKILILIRLASETASCNLKALIKQAIVKW